MIITGDNPKQPIKGQNSSANPSNAGPSADLPPSYGATQSTQPYPQSTQPYRPQVQAYPAPPPVIVYRQSPGRRFCRAFVFAVLIWFLISLLVQSMFGVARWTHRHNNLQGVWGDLVVPSDVTLQRCVTPDKWSNERWSNRPVAQDAISESRFPYSSETSFELPLSYDTLFLLSRGSQSYGIVDVVTSSTPSDVAKVNVVVRYYDRGVRDVGAKVCLSKRPNNEIGVGIFTREWHGPSSSQHTLYFHITVTLPQSADLSKPRVINNFETDLHNGRHQLGALRGLVDFQTISLKASNAAIIVESLAADTAIIQTSNGPIEGVFNTSRSLTLKTSNSPIKVDVGVHSDDDHISELVMRTSNGKIDSSVSLTTSSSSGGRYLVTGSTSNSPLYINFPTSPLKSTLKLQATTSNSPARVSLHPTYEGSFSLTTSLFTPTVRRQAVDDPAGKGRERTVEMSTYGKGTLKGSVSWTKEQGPGSVNVKTSNSPVTLEL